MKVLVLSPGEPSFVNSGLGIAANAINTELRALASLIIVQPENKSIGDIISEQSTQTIAVNKIAFGEEKIIQQESKIRVSAQLDPYHYSMHLGHGTAITKAEISSIKKELSQYTRQVVQQVTPLDFDVIYAHDWITLKAAMNIKQKTRKPLVVHIHSLDYDRGGNNDKSFVFDLEYKGLQKADIIVAVSQYTANILREHYAVPADKIKVIYNAVYPVKLPRIKKTVPEKLVLFVGRLSGQKGPGIFMDIAESLMKKREDVRFVMVGGGELMKQLIERGANPLSMGKFHFTGNIGYKDVLKLYAMADIYCMPSVSEPFGLSAIEAASAGLPMVISKQSGAAEVLEGVLTSDHWDVDSFVRNIELLLDEVNVAKKSVSLNKKSIKQLSWKKVSKELIKIFENLITIDGPTV